jgi:hypothetical protein
MPGDALLTSAAAGGAAAYEFRRRRRPSEWLEWRPAERGWWLAARLLLRAAVGAACWLLAAFGKALRLWLRLRHARAACGWLLLAARWRRCRSRVRPRRRAGGLRGCARAQGVRRACEFQPARWLVARRGVACTTSYITVRITSRITRAITA